MVTDGILIIDGITVLRNTRGIKHQVMIDTRTKRVTKHYLDRPGNPQWARQSLERESRLLAELQKYSFIPRLLGVDRAVLEIHLQYAGDPLWSLEPGPADPTFADYPFSVQAKYCTDDIREQVVAIIRILLLDEAIRGEYFINNFVVDPSGRVVCVDFDDAERLPATPKNQQKLREWCVWWLERWNYWIPPQAERDRSDHPTGALPALDFSQAKTYSLEKRQDKVVIDQMAKPPSPGCSFARFIEGLPAILAADDFRQLVQAIVSAHLNRRAVALALGAHIIKTGLSPLIINLMQQGVVTSLALNGGGSIHDFELAMVGHTSENVAQGLATGTFGMAEETGRWMNGAINHAWQQDGPSFSQGLGELLGEKLLELQAPYQETSLLATGVKLGVPVTVHVALGAEVLHMHPNANGGAIGQASMNDFHRFATALRSLGQGGVYLNIGSAVILPEVFLKALNLLRNLGEEIVEFTTANLDMQQHYRPHENVLTRPTAAGGKGIALTGHHELLLPMLAQAIVEELAHRRQA
jgi:deoxyhypusine synthase